MKRRKKIFHNYKCFKLGQRKHLSKDCKKSKKEVGHKHVANLLDVENILSESNKKILNCEDKNEKT